MCTEFFFGHQLQIPITAKPHYLTSECWALSVFIWTLSHGANLVSTFSFPLLLSFQGLFEEYGLIATFSCWLLSCNPLPRSYSTGRRKPAFWLEVSILAEKVVRPRKLMPSSPVLIQSCLSRAQDKQPKSPTWLPILRLCVRFPPHSSNMIHSTSVVWLLLAPGPPLTAGQNQYPIELKCNRGQFLGSWLYRLYVLQLSLKSWWICLYCFQPMFSTNYYLNYKIR